MGRVFKQRGRNVWLLKYYQHGRAIVESARTTNKTEATKILRMREGKIAEGHTLTPNRLSLRDALGAVVTDYRINRRRSVTDVERRIRLHVQPAFSEHLRLVDLTTRTVQEYIAARIKAGASNASVNREIALIKRAFTLAIRAGLVMARPHLPMLDERNARAGFFAPADFEAVKAALPGVWQGPVTFAYLTGWRLRAEILPLTWRQVDRAAGTVRLDPETTKNREGRLFPYAVLPALLACVEGQIGKSDTWVFPDATGARLTNWIGAHWRTACAAAGVAGAIPHDLRRTAIRNLVRAGVPEKVAMTLTGHKTRSIFDRYDIVNEADLRTAVEKLR